MTATTQDMTRVGLISDDPAWTGKILELMRDDPRKGSRDGEPGSPVETSQTYLDGFEARFRIVATTPADARDGEFNAAIVLFRVGDDLYAVDPPADAAFEGRASLEAVAAADVPYLLAAVYPSHRISVLERYEDRRQAAGLPAPIATVEVFPVRDGRPVRALFHRLADLRL